MGFTSPIEDGLLTGSAVTIEAEAGDDRRVEKVEFSIDGSPIGTDTSAPYSVSWNSTTASNASHTLSAKATDDVGNISTESIPVEVANTAAPATTVTSPSSRYADVVKAYEPYGYWRLGEASGTTVADASGKGNTGTLSGSYTLAQPGLLTGDTDKAIKLRNTTTDGKVTIGGLTGQSSATVSVEAWISYAVAAGIDVESEVASRGWGSAGGWRLSVYKGGDGQPRAKFVVNVAGTVKQATGLVTPGKNLIAGRFSGSSVGVFVNGVYATGVTTGTQALNTTSSVLLGGSLNEDLVLDEVAIYPKSMASAEEKLHYEVGLGQTPTLSGTGNPMTAAASDDRSVHHVDFYVDGNYIGNDTTVPYSVPLKTQVAGEELWNGTHTLTSKAYDAEEQEKQSTTESIKVDNAGGAAKYAAEYAEVTAAPTELTYDPAAATQDEAGMEIDVTNRSPNTWAATDVVLKPRWIAPDGTITDQAEVPLGSDLPAGQTRRATVKFQPPAPPDGQSKAQYTLRVDAYSKTDSKWFGSDKGCKPHDKPVVVKKAGGELGLEDWFQYDGEELGGGMQHLANLGTGNSLVRFSPLASTGRGLSTIVDLTYNSLEDRSESPVGDNWSLSISGLTRFGTPLDVHPNKADDIGGNAKRYIELTDGDGTVHRFTGKTAGDGTKYWEEPAGVHLYLREYSTTDTARKWAITRPDGVTFFFATDGHPTSVEDHHGNKLTFTLEAVPPGEDPGGQKKRISAVTDAAGRAYTIAYYSKASAPKPRIRGRVRSIRDHAGAGETASEVLFKYYDDGNLWRVSHTGGKTATGRSLASRAWYFTYTTSSGSGPAIADPADRVTPDPHTPNQSSRLFSVRDPRKHETRFSYHGSGRDRWKLASRTARSGAVTSYAYDTTTRTTTMTAPLSRVWKYGFDTNAQVIKITNPKSEDMTLAWTPDRHVETVTTPRQTGTATQRFAYNANGMLTDVWNEENDQTHLSYTDLKVDANDVSGKWKSGRSIPHLSRLREKTSPKGMVAGAVPDDFSWVYGYDSPTSLGNLTSVRDPERAVTTLTPNADGTVASVSDPNGTLTSYQYDPSGQPSRITERVSATEDNVAQLGYDDDGYLLWVQDPRHASDSGAAPREYRSYFDYDSWHRLGRQSAPKWTAGDRGNLIWSGVVHDANDNVTTDYGPHYGRQWTVGGATTTIQYDDMDRTERTYGPDTTVDPQGERWRFSYDAAGNLIQATDPRGMASVANDKDGATYFKYDVLDRLERETRDELNGSTVVRSLHTHYCYDKAGDLVTTLPPAANVATADCTNPGAKATRFAYDAAHRQTSQTEPGLAASAVAYDRNGNVASTTDESGAKTEHFYDRRDALVKVVEPFSGPAATPTRKLTTRLQYDTGGRLLREASPRAVDKLGDKASYAADEDYVTSYQYDGVDRLTRVQLPKGPDVGTHYVHRSYDRNGNLSSVSQPVDSADSASSERRTDLKYMDTGWVRENDRPARRRVKYDYTAEGWQAAMTPLRADGTENVGRQRLWSYFADGMLREQRSGINQDVDSYTYDANNNLTLGRDASGIVREGQQKPIELTVDYDSLDRATKVRHSDSETGPTGNWTVTQYAYDLNSNLQERIDNRRETQAGTEVSPGRRHTFNYDDADRQVNQTDYASPSAPTAQRVIDLAYDATGRQKERKVSKDGSVRQLVSWDYLLNGSLQTMTTKAGPDAASLAVKESHVLAYLENGDTGAYLNGHRTRDVWKRESPKTSLPCRTQTCTTTFRYDGRDRLVNETQDRGGSTKTTNFELTASGNVSWEHRVEQNRKWHSTYTGDQLDTREQYEQNGGNWVKTSDPLDDFRYHHEPATGNLECVTALDGTRAADCNPAAGTTRSAKLWADYAYDADDKLKGSRLWKDAASQTPADEATYDYDALDRPVAEREDHAGWATGRLTKLAYLGTGDELAEEQQLKITKGSQSDTGTLDETKQYSYDPFGTRMSMTDTVKGQSGNPDTTRGYLYGHDPHENVSMLLTDGGTARASYGYTTSGDRDSGLTAELKVGSPDTTSNDNDLTDQQNPLNPYRYTGKRLDSGSGQLDMGARRYGPDTGRFLQEDYYDDALGDLSLSTDSLSNNRYALGAGNPVSFVEVDGHALAAENGTAGGAKSLNKVIDTRRANETSARAARNTPVSRTARAQVNHYRTSTIRKPIRNQLGCTNPSRQLCPKYKPAKAAVAIDSALRGLVGDDPAEIAFNFTPFGKGFQALKGLYKGGKASYQGIRTLTRGRRGTDTAARGASRGAPFPTRPVRPEKIHGLEDALTRARKGSGRISPDGKVFENRYGNLPEGNYTEWNVPTPGVAGPGKRRLVFNEDTEQAFYTWNHYNDFVPVRTGR